MNLTGFVLDIIMEFLTLYLGYLFLLSYIHLKKSNFLILAIAFFVFFFTDLIESITVNLMDIKLLESYYVHDLIIILVLAALVYVIRQRIAWKMPLRRE